MRMPTTTTTTKSASSTPYALRLYQTVILDEMADQLRCSPAPADEHAEITASRAAEGPAGVLLRTALSDADSDSDPDRTRDSTDTAHVRTLLTLPGRFLTLVMRSAVGTSRACSFPYLLCVTCVTCVTRCVCGACVRVCVRHTRSGASRSKRP